MGVRDGYAGTKAHGNFQVGLTAVLVTPFDSRTRSLWLHNAGPGILYAGTSAVSTTNTVPIPVGTGMILDQSGDPTYVVADQAATEVKFIRELAP